MAMQVQDPRRHLAATCKKKQAFKMGKLGKLQGALDGLRTDHPIINGIAGVEKGLDAVVGVTMGSVGGVADFIAGGVGGVMETVLGESGAGIGGAVFAQVALKKINPLVHKKVEDAAGGILNKVSKGKVSSLSEFAGPFNQAVEVAGNMLGKVATADEMVKCSASPYAADLISRGVKHKYMFVADFEFSADYTDSKLDDLDHAFVIKQSDRPTVNFEYEDINMYNYRTQSIKSAKYNPISMKFYDDLTGQALAFYSMYLKVMSPIANLRPGHHSQDHNLLESELGGMQFSDYGGKGASQITAGHIQENQSWDKDKNQNTQDIDSWKYAASVGPLHSSGFMNGRNIMQRMRIFHVYGGGAFMDVYTFVNPRVTEMQLDELSMEDSGVNEVGMTFAYDSVLIEPRLSASPLSTYNMKESGYNLQTLTDGKSGMQAKYPLVHYGPPMDTWYNHLANHPKATLDNLPDPATGELPKPKEVNSWTSKITGGMKDFFKPYADGALGGITKYAGIAAGGVTGLAKSGANAVSDAYKDATIGFDRATKNSDLDDV